MKKIKENEIEINGNVYVLKELISKHNNLAHPYVMVRTHSAGVHCGCMIRRNGKEVELKNSIRIWRWEGAASLSQLATEGTKKPDKCKFGVQINTSIILTEAIEIIEMTDKAVHNIINVESWRV